MFQILLNNFWEITLQWDLQHGVYENVRKKYKTRVGRECKKNREKFMEKKKNQPMMEAFIVPRGSRCRSEVREKKYENQN
ncbi:TonB-linked outer membrane protein, SusC/RagA family [Sesbania bispinosa]|nr:TonB-linked outer membrane protein, SusC/RagA family [Sesbania bispinosa]